MNASVANQRTRIKLHTKVFERIKESKQGNFVNLYESNNFESHSPFTSIATIN